MDGARSFTDTSGTLRSTNSSQELICISTLQNTEVIIKVVDTPSLATSGKWI
jgi:hypothetical protein